MELFPHVLIRLSGGAFEQLEAQYANDSMALLDQLWEQQQANEQRKEALCDAIHACIPEQEDTKVQNLLLNFRRDIYNDRKINDNKINKVAPFLPKELLSEISQYREALKNIKIQQAAGKARFEEEIVQARQQLYKASQDVNLRKGLLLSSQSLMDRIEKYLRSSKVKLNKKELQTELSLMKYLTRMLAKTSPFSTFTNLSMGDVVSGTDAPQDQPFLQVKDPETRKVTSHIRLNNYLYNYAKGLMLKNPDIYRWFYLRPNPTIQQANDHFLFLTNFNNIESFQRIPFNAVIELFQQLASEQKEGTRYKDLVQTILDEEYIDAEEAELEAYINQLIEFGFFEFNLGVSGIDPDWDLKLLDRLAPVAAEVPLVKELLDALVRLRQLANAYGEGDLSVRRQILEDAYEDFRAMCMKLHEAAGLPEEERMSLEDQRAFYKAQQEEKDKEQQEEEAAKDADEDAATDPEEAESDDEEEEVAFKQQTNTYFHFKPEQLFYEDTTLDVAADLHGDRLHTFVESLQTLMEETTVFEGFSTERDAMEHYFKQQYEPGQAVDLMTFYEDFFRDYKKPMADLQQKHKDAVAEAKRKARERQKKIQAGEDPGEKVSIPDGMEVPAELKVPRIDEREQDRLDWLKAFVKVKLDHISGQEEHLDYKIADLQKANSVFGKTYPNTARPNSFAMFVQLFEEVQPDGSRKLQGAMNFPSPGFGKWISRFLHIFDDRITEAVREWNSKLAKENQLFAEDTDASMFNANLHPPLMPYEVWMPGGHNSLEPDKQIPITDINVHLKEATGEVYITHKPTGKEIMVYDLGFQAIKGRSQLYRLLSIFSLIRYIYPNRITGNLHSIWDKKRQGEPIDLDKSPTEKKKGETPTRQNIDPTKYQPVWISPRITFEDKYIFQRKSWYVPKDQLPLCEPNETEWDYFCRLNLWRKTWGIPEEVFIFLTNQQELENLPHELRKRITRDDYKPQYISFRNPLTVTLFEKALHKVPQLLRIEEMLPGSSHLIKVGDQRHISEYLVQWYVNE